MQRNKGISVTDLNPFLICGLCKGYLIDATTLVDCLHSFCRSCLLKFFVTKPERHCPVCNNGPLKKITGLEFMRQDRHLQSIVYKLVPKLYKDEMRRRKEFYEVHGPDMVVKDGPDLPASPERVAEKPDEATGPGNTASVNGTDGLDHEMVSVSLQFVDSATAGPPASPGASSSSSSSPSTSDASPVTTSSSNNATATPLAFHLLCPAGVTVGVLQKFLRLKFDLNATGSTSSRFDVRLFAGDFFDEPLPAQYSLREVACISLWRRRAPLQLAYSIFVYPQEEKAPGTAPMTNGLPNSPRSHAKASCIVNGVA